MSRGVMHCSSRQELSTKREAAIPQNCIIDQEHILQQKATIWSRHTLTAVFSVLLPFPAPLLYVYREDGVYGQAHWASLLPTELPILFQPTSNGDCLEERKYWFSISGLLMQLSSFYSSNKWTQQYKTPYTPCSAVDKKGFCLLSRHIFFVYSWLSWS